MDIYIYLYMDIYICKVCRSYGFYPLNLVYDWFAMLHKCCSLISKTRGQHGANVGPTWDQRVTNVGSTWGQRGVNVGPTESQRSVNAGPT